MRNKLINWMIDNSNYTTDNLTKLIISLQSEDGDVKAQDLSGILTGDREEYSKDLLLNTLKSILWDLEESTIFNTVRDGESNLKTIIKNKLIEADELTLDGLTHHFKSKHMVRVFLGDNFTDLELEQVFTELRKELNSNKDNLVKLVSDWLKETNRYNKANVKVLMDALAHPMLHAEESVSLELGGGKSTYTNMELLKAAKSIREELKTASQQTHGNQNSKEVNDLLKQCTDFMEERILSNMPDKDKSTYLINYLAELESSSYINEIFTDYPEIDHVTSQSILRVALLTILPKYIPQTVDHLLEYINVKLA